MSEASEITATDTACECADKGCPMHKGSECSAVATCGVMRTDMGPNSGPWMCEGCADDALEPGVFAPLEDGLPLTCPCCEANAIERFEVLAGNIGTVLRTADEATARETFKRYATDAECGVGRGGYHDVALFEDGEPIAEYYAPRCAKCGEYTFNPRATACDECTA